MRRIELYMKVCTEVEIFSQFVSAVSVVSTPIGGGDTPTLTAIIEFIFKMVGTLQPCSSIL